mmetsp:Transcript_72305/g.207456  ORF Transcript_72305/g.207456 Transcript_72305/m.207456 type:complete len:244 (+) Transcript_72305:249-980(+)
MFRSKLYRCTPATKTIAPRALPIATGTMLAAMSNALTSAPRSMPSGSRNMFAIECSRPNATNVMTGSHKLAIFAADVCAEDAWKMATLTSQLAQAPFPTAMASGKAHFFTVSAVSQAAAGLPMGTMERAKQVTAKNKLPARFPAPLMPQMRQVLATTWLFETPGCVHAGSAMVTKLPVSSSEPESSTMERPTGKTAPVRSERRPGASARTAAEPPATTTVSAQPQPRRDPPKKELQKICPSLR